MERIELKLQCPFRIAVSDCINFTILKKGFQKYCLIIGAPFLISLGLAKFGFFEENNILVKIFNVLFWFSGFLLMFPFSAIIGATMIGYAQVKSQEKNLIYYIDKDGYNIESTADCYYSSRFFIGWDQLDEIVEAKNSFQLKKKKNPTYIIYKHNLPAETISKIKELLSELPIQNKKLLIEN
ncbi:hypothetical protein ACFL3G_13440 [Planctomycetota bacterium]